MTEKKKGGGRRLATFRSGDRSEYMARFVLSRVAFVNEVARQEDFGVVDMMCVLAREEGKFVYPESAFNVQTKSNRNDIVYNADACQWLWRHMNNPLYVCVIDKKDEKIAIYAGSRLSYALLVRCETTQLTLMLRDPPPETNFCVYTDDPKAPVHVYAGQAIFEQTVSEIEEDDSTLYNVLSAWAKQDTIALATGSIGRITTTLFQTWKPNEAPVLGNATYFFGTQYAQAEAPLAKILTGLAHNYRHAGDATKLEALSTFLNVIREHLDPHGIDFADRKNKVE